jgi:Xaa-Pro aminopeptidase/Xaa-Pro dipeptidase
MEEHGLDVVLTHTKHNGSYLADYWCKPRMGDPAFPLLVHPLAQGYQWAATFVGLPKDEAKSAFIVGWSEEANYMAYRDVWIRDRRFWGPKMTVTGRRKQIDLYPQPLDAVAQALQDRGLGEGNVGLEMRLMPVPFFQRLRELLPGAAFVDAEAFLQKLQMIKSPEEVERFRKAALATERAIEAMYAAAHEGITDRELVKVMKRTLVDEGADHYGENLAIGPEGASMVGATGRTLRAGEIVRVDLGGSYDGYPCDLSRARVFGKPSPEMKRVHDVIRTANEALREAIGPGVKCSDLYRLGTEMMERGGLKLLNPYIGHSIGRERAHQYPFFMECDHTVLQPGMVMVPEPTVRYEGVGSVNIEDVVLVTEDGHEEITTISRHLAPIS